jgi:hypothetical protein
MANGSGILRAERASLGGWVSGQLVLIAAAGALVGCGPHSVRITMKSDNNSGQAGFAVLTDQGSKTRVEVDILESLVADGQPSHVHTGSCGEIGPIVAPLQPIMSSGKGDKRARAEAVINMKLDDLLKAPHAINVHDPIDLSLYVSCGEIREP